MGKIYAVNCDDLPYGPGQSDYEYDKRRQEEVDMDERLLAAASPYGNTPAEIYANIRDRALEEAAQAVPDDTWREITADEARYAIRALKSKP